MITSPIAIGGVGGSGTRLIASLLSRAGYYLGDDLNKPLDNLWFTFLLKRRELWPLEQNTDAINTALNLFVNVMSQRKQISAEDRKLIDKLTAEPRLHHPLNWREGRRMSLLKFLDQPPVEQTKWGWKEPNTHLLLPHLERHLDQFKYIHVMRHGLDMAVSNNQNQLVYWGPKLLDLRVERRNPKHSLSFWCKSQRNVIETGETMGDRFLLLNFDELCSAPERHLPGLLEFVGAENYSMDSYLTEITKPPSTGRRRWLSPDSFNPQDIEYVRHLGFEV